MGGRGGGVNRESSTARYTKPRYKQRASGRFPMPRQAWCSVAAGEVGWSGEEGSGGNGVCACLQPAHVARQTLTALYSNCTPRRNKYNRHHKK